MLPAANTIAEIVKLGLGIAYEVIHKDQRELIDVAYKESAARVATCRDALLRGDLTTVQLIVDGMQFGIPCDISPDQFNRLRETRLNEHFDAYDLLGFIQRAEGARFQSRCREIIQTADKPQ